MRAKDIAYDTGFVRNGEISRENFDLDVVKRELAIIRDDLHCNAVHIVGGDPGRLELAARCAAELGLEVWFSPSLLELTTTEIMSLFADCAERAERLRKTGADVVFVTGVELSIMNQGFPPGDSLEKRLGLLLSQFGGRGERLVEVNARLNDFLAHAVATVRERFGGKITYGLHTVRACRLGSVRHRVGRTYPVCRGGRPIPGRRAQSCRTGKTGRDHRLRRGHLAWRG